MSDVFKSGSARVQVSGIEALRAKLLTMPEKMRKGVVRKLLRESMKVVREDARATVPTLAQPVTGPDGLPRRLPGTVRKAISVRTSKIDEQAGNAGVFVNVRPLKGNIYKGKGPGRVLVKKSLRGADNPRDPYYWRWLEFGTKSRRTKRGKALGAVRAYGFLQHAAGKLGAAVEQFTKNMAAWVAKTDQTGRIE